MKPAIVAPILAATLFPCGLFAQDVPAVRADIAREATVRVLAPVESQSAAPLAPGPGQDAPKLPGDAEYGVQKVIVRRSNWEPWQAGAFGGLTYSTNPALLHDNAIEDFLFQGGVYASYTPQLRGNWFGDFSAGQSFYDYDDLDVLDFAQTYANVGVMYATPSNAPGIFRNTVATLRYHFESLTEIDDLGGDFFIDHAIQLGAQRTFRISRGQRAYVGLTGRWSVDSTVERAARDEYSALCGYRLEWTPQFSTTADLRTSIYHYRDADRTDWNNIVSATSEYKLTDWAAVSASLGWIFNLSDESSLDYNSGSLGALLNLNVRF